MISRAEQLTVETCLQVRNAHFPREVKVAELQQDSNW